MKGKTKKRIIVSVTTDLISDNRVHKTCTALTEMGFDVLLIGRKLPESLVPEPRIYEIRRFNLIFKKGFLFYASFNLHLFFFLIFSKFDLLLANDLDTLAANFLASKLKGKHLVYDSHEYFTEVPELVGRAGVRKIWEWLELKMVPHIKYAYTVCGSIAEIYTKKYGVPFAVVRNVPFAVNTEQNDTDITENSEKIILYQGAVNIGRGLKQAIVAMKYVNYAKLVIAGDGDIRQELEQFTEMHGLSDKVQFLGRMPIEKLAKYTPKASVGLSIEEDLGLNYRFALPNKLFDYISAHVPVLVTNLPEMAAIVKTYGVGEITETLEPEYLAQKISMMLTDKTKRKIWKENLMTASRELTWENEKKVLIDIFKPFLDL